MQSPAAGQEHYFNFDHPLPSWTEGDDNLYEDIFSPSNHNQPSPPSTYQHLFNVPSYMQEEVPMVPVPSPKPFSLPELPSPLPEWPAPFPPIQWPQAEAPHVPLRQASLPRGSVPRASLPRASVQPAPLPRASAPLKSSEGSARPKPLSERASAFLRSHGICYTPAQPAEPELRKSSRPHEIHNAYGNVVSNYGDVVTDTYGIDQGYHPKFPYQEFDDGAYEDRTWRFSPCIPPPEI